MSSTEASLQLPSRATGRRFAPHHAWDHNFFLLWVVLIWFGILMGFVPEITQHFATHATPYPIIIHIHAAAFVGWLVLLTAQVLLIRNRRLDLHRRLGMLGAVLAGAMVIIGPLTALMMHRLRFGEPGHDDPPFLSVQLTDILAFAGLIAAALIWRRSAPAHKRLMLIATLYISDAGFARWLGQPVGGLLLSGKSSLYDAFVSLHGSSGLWVSLGAFLAVAYLGNDLLLLGLGGYDWITRRRLHPAYVAGVAWTLLLQVTAGLLYLSPAWTPVALHLIRGHA